ncbi:MAG: competence/damage-inducible protein A [Bdellovibrionia bacterium]
MHSTESKATLLTVGTELTTGQIMNKNAAWISEKLAGLGVEVLMQQTVPDDHELILKALEQCKSMSQLIFVTGGLGPTTDDFTRNVVAEWLNEPLEFHDLVWQDIEHRLHSLGVPVAESNQRQCYFPSGCDIIPNPEGTAAGFSSLIRGTKKRIWVFPGPPREVESVWNQGVEGMIRALLPQLKPLKVFSWNCTGRTEAEFGELTEATIEGSSLKTGYRAHRPIVEVKVWCEESQLPQNQKWIDALDRALAPWALSKQGKNLAQELIDKLLGHEDIEVIDASSGGILAERLGTLLRQLPRPRQPQALAFSFVTQWNPLEHPTSFVQEVLERADPDSITLVLGGTQEGRACIGLRNRSRVHQDVLQSPYSKPELIDRARHYFVEIALKKWCDWLEHTTH